MNKNLPASGYANEPTLRETAAPLFDVAERAKRALKPVTPTPEFRARLRNGLRMAARHQQAQQLLIRTHPKLRWGWLIGAAALGSAAGLAAILVRSRQAHQHAGSRQTSR